MLNLFAIFVPLSFVTYICEGFALIFLNRARGRHQQACFLILLKLLTSGYLILGL